MAEKDYTKDSKKWPPTPGKPGWQAGPIAKNTKINGGKVNSVNEEKGVRA